MKKAERNNIYRDAYHIFSITTYTLRGVPLCMCVERASNYRSCNMKELTRFRPPDKNIFWTCGMADEEAKLFRETVLLFCIAMTDS